MIRNREEKELRVLGIVRRIQRVKKMGKKRGRGEVRKRRIDRKRRVDFGEAGAYQLRQRLNTKGHRDKRAWVVSLLPVDFIFSRLFSVLPLRCGISLLIERGNRKRREKDGTRDS